MNDKVIPLRPGILITHSEPIDIDADELLEAEQYRDMLLTAVKRISQLEWEVVQQERLYRKLRERITVLEDWPVHPKRSWWKIWK